MEEPKNEVASYWEEGSILQKHLLNDRFLKDAYDTLCFIKKEIHLQSIAIDNLQIEVQHNPSGIARLEYSKQILDRAHQRHNEVMMKLTYLINEENKCRPSKIIDMLVLSDRAADMQANLAEVFPLWVDRHGLVAAHRIRKVQIARLIIGEYWNKAIELIKAVKLAGS